MQGKPLSGRVRRVVMIAIPVVMLSFGALTVVVGGLRAAIALIPILAVHVAVALVAIPLWRRYRRRRAAAQRVDQD